MTNTESIKDTVDRLVRNPEVMAAASSLTLENFERWMRNNAERLRIRIVEADA